MSALSAWLPWFATIAYLLGTLLTVALPKRAWQMLTLATDSALFVTLAAPFALWRQSPIWGYFDAALVSGLVALIAWVIGRYSKRYLDGEPRQARYVTALLITLTGASVVIETGHFAMLILGWAVSSAGLHQLLTFYSHRPAALIVAHKKFLVSRLAEAFLVVAAIMLYLEWGTLSLPALAKLLIGVPQLPLLANLAACSIAVAAILKCAQLPLHGWLIQVMEAPTPVSALLHAGVVNLGGYVLIRFGALIAASPDAQRLLVCVGSLTAVLAGLVMTTRITIKVRLAWSTCSQMGLMLTECGLGLYDLALLHLVAHALYKAYAFLSAGEALSSALAREVTASAAPRALQRYAGLAPLWALPVALTVVLGSSTMWSDWLSVTSLPWVALAVMACGLATLLWSPAPGPVGLWLALARLFALTQLYFAWHALLCSVRGPDATSVSTFLAVWVIACFLVLYLGQWFITSSARRSLGDRLYGWVYAGFYLDERFTHLTFRLWPPRVPINDQPRSHGTNAAQRRLT